MKRHVKVYMEHHGYGEQDFIPCLVCQKKASDIHHLIPKGMGGSKTKDKINNLVALCRACHDLCHKDKNFNELVKIMQNEQNKT
jgi:hypothetical protein